MSVTFSPRGYRIGVDDPRWLNLANMNARDLLYWLGYAGMPLYGSLDATELKARCRRRLWNEARNFDPELPSRREQRLLIMGRRPGYLREKTAQLLVIAELANGEVDCG